MWSYLTTRTFIDLLSGYVESKADDTVDGLRLAEITLVLAPFDHIAGFFEDV
jgi:hypothetical protein